MPPFYPLMIDPTTENGSSDALESE